MRLAILIGANPKVYQNTSPTILKKGTWKIIPQGFIDSICVLSVGSEVYSVGDTITLKNTSPINVDFTTKGSEKVVSILAERVS